MANLVACKACGKEIAKGVKKCVHCGKDQRNFFQRHKILTGIGVLIIIGIISSAAGGGGKTTTTSGTATTPTKQEVKAFKVNEPFKVDKTEFTVTKVEEKDQVGNEFLNKKVSDGGTFVATQYTIKNVGDKPLNPFSIQQAKLVDENGTEYTSDIDASGDYSAETNADNSKFASDLNPNIQVTAVKVFEISKESYGKGKWYLKFGNEKVEIK